MLSVSLSIGLASVILRTIILRVPVRTNNRIAPKIGFALAIIHLVSFVLLALYVRNLRDPQAPLLLAVCVFVDFPVSLLDLLFASLHLQLANLEKPAFEFLYPPYFIHGLLGTIWWYFLPRLVTPRRLGGVW